MSKPLSLIYTDLRRSPVYRTVNLRKIFRIFTKSKNLRKQLKLPAENVASQPLSLSRFIDLLYREWPIESRLLLDGLADQFIEDLSPNHLWSLDLWTKYLELTLSRGELPVIENDESGIWVANLSHADWTELSHTIVVGCTQSYLREQLKSPAQAQDIFFD